VIVQRVISTLATVQSKTLNVVNDATAIWVGAASRLPSAPLKAADAFLKLSTTIIGSCGLQVLAPGKTPKSLALPEFATMSVSVKSLADEAGLNITEVSANVKDGRSYSFDTPVVLSTARMQVNALPKNDNYSTTEVLVLIEGAPGLTVEIPVQPQTPTGGTTAFYWA
jgi:hypothetical protein